MDVAVLPKLGSRHYDTVFRLSRQWGQLVGYILGVGDWRDHQCEMEDRIVRRIGGEETESENEI
jgi:hypothetical protein